MDSMEVMKFLTNLPSFAFPPVMTHMSPAVSLAWVIMTVMLESFLVYHIWSFDHFKCIKWNNGKYSGAFKRIMTYSYLTGVPLVMIYAVGLGIIKYTYGYIFIPGVGIVPTPYEVWSQRAQSAIFPLYLCLSVAWGLEMVTHLEELCFWLFVMNSGSAQQKWFQSRYFRTWAFGSGVAIIYMPLVTIFTRKDPFKCEAYTFLAGSLGSVSLTIWFLPVLWAFPKFLETLKRANVDFNTIVRLVKFHELNCIRIIFRFFFTVPLVILGVDGVRPHQHINDKMFATDLLVLIAGIGFVVSSGITLVIFFPRSVKQEIANREEADEHRQQFPLQFKGNIDLPEHSHRNPMGEDSMNAELGGQRACTNELFISAAADLISCEMEAETNTKYGPYVMSPSLSLKPNRRAKNGHVELGNAIPLTETALLKHNVGLRHSNVSHLVYNWRTPLEIGEPLD